MGDIGDLYGGGFDTQRDDAATGFDPIPAGWYPMHIDAAEVKATKSGTGKFLRLELEIVGEKFAGRKLFPNITLQNPSAKAVEIGMRELAALGQACGLLQMQDSSEIVGKTISARVKIRAAQGDYGADNEVTAYKPLDGAAPAPGRRPPAAEPTRASGEPANATRPTPVAAAPSAKRPWER